MKVNDLTPTPSCSAEFEWNMVRYVPEGSGCYVLATFMGVVLYLGRTTSLRERMRRHLDDPTKTSPTRLGRAVRFVWFESEDIERVERTWANLHIQQEGRLPVLNVVYPAVST